jgi:hypothetical protein
MDEFHFSNLRKLSGNKLKLEKSKVELSTLQNFLSVKGEFRTVVRNATCGIETKFLVSGQQVQQVQQVQLLVSC